ncbi:unnamed protein product [Haemonchus placei]|uniref:Reverse transcriptase domain-containing protein n=1 Tax=Haemonchus placei TaxID=6290 RepID=A0A0N4WT33_HAEPC|nr:unnamed protein product [Haemonchus placei]
MFCYVGVSTNVIDLRVVQGYLPDITCPDIEYQEFLEQISEALSARFHNQGCIVDKRNLIEVALGDSDAKIGSGMETEMSLGRYGLETRNEERMYLRILF